MTEDEFIEKYGDVAVKFSDYYKYSFIYIGQLSDGKKILCTFGSGDADDIYRHEVCAEEYVKIKELCPMSGSVYGNDGNKLEGFDVRY